MIINGENVNSQEANNIFVFHEQRPLVAKASLSN